MSDTTTTAQLPITNEELFDSAISDTPSVEVTPEPASTTPATTEAPAPTADETGRLHDPVTGKFASKSTPAAEPAVAPPVDVVPPVTGQQPDNEGRVPSWRLREVTEEREAANRRALDAEARSQAVEREMATLRRQNQPAQEPIDVYADPVGAFKQQLSPFEEQLRTTNASNTLKISRLEAMIVHGKDAVIEAENAIGEAMKAGNPAMRTLAMQMQNSEDPVGVAMQWHQREKLLKETGGDLSSYANKIKQDALKDPAFLAQVMEAARAQASGQAPNGKPNTTVQLPPSLNRAPSSASPHDEPGDLSNESLFAYATR